MKNKFLKLVLLTCFAAPLSLATASQNIEQNQEQTQYVINLESFKLKSDGEKREFLSNNLKWIKPYFSDEQSDKIPDFMKVKNEDLKNLFQQIKTNLDKVEFDIFNDYIHSKYA